MRTPTRRLTVARALVEFLAQQVTERDGQEHRLFAGCFGIFGHGNVAGVGEALYQVGDRLRYYQARNEQAMVHTATAFARMRNRMSTLACTTSIGPGATNLVTGAATATINRLPVLLLPGDTFATRVAAPVLQQLEAPGAFDVSVNDCLRPVSRFWDRVSRPEQLPSAMLEAVRVLTDPAETGAVTICLPQDVQTEAYAFPAELFAQRVWHVPRQAPEPGALRRVIEAVRASHAPLLIAGGGVIYSEATTALAELATATGIPVAETQAGKGAMPVDHPCALGAVGVTGTPGANAIAAAADLVIGVGTRWSDFTTASRTLFQNGGVRFANLNVARSDAAKLQAIELSADARVGLEALADGLVGWEVGDGYRHAVREHGRTWEREVQRVYELGHGPLPSQAEVIGAVNEAVGSSGVVVSAAGSMPGDLHRLWRSRHPKAYHVEYGFSCMGYEIAGGLGVKMADPDRTVYVLVGDGSYLMLAQEIVTSIQEALPLVIVLVDNHGFASIGSLSSSLGSRGFGTSYRYRGPDSQQLDGAVLPVDFAANAASLGADVATASTVGELRRALAAAGQADRTTLIYVEVDPDAPSAAPSGAWWDVPVAAASDREDLRVARVSYDEHKAYQRPLVSPAEAREEETTR